MTAPVAASPRVERSKAAILSATIGLLAEGGVAGLTVDAVAARAGVGKATVYRHWTGRTDLIVDAVVSLIPATSPVDHGSLHADLAATIERVAAVCTQPPLCDILPSLVEAAERDPELGAVHRQFVAERRRPLLDALARAEARGDLRPGLDHEVVADLLSGPIFYKRLVHHEQPAAGYLSALLDLVLAAVAPRA